jgi:SAM-dependent methyltransferase
MLDLIRLSPRTLFPPGGVELYRQIAILTGMREGMEVLDVGCGKAVTLEYFVREHGVHGSGIEHDARLVQSALDRIRGEGLGDRLQVQCAPADQLPYRDEIFDVAVGELGMTQDADPEAAVRELVRVTRPGGVVVLVQLVWTAPVDPARRRVLAAHLGVEPRMLVEWKRWLRGAGLRDLHIEDWTDPETAFRPRVVKPFPDFAELFSLSEKLGILRRAWSRWGWRGVKAVVAREREVHRLLTHERILGLDLIKGTRTVADTGEDRRPGPSAAAARSGTAADAMPDEEPSDDATMPVDEPSDDDAPRDQEPSDDDATAPVEDTRGLPLFTPDES